MSSDRKNAFLLAALILVLFADVLFLGRGFYKGDLYVYHFPMKKVVRDLVLESGLPQWNPAYQGGQPLAANPAYELFYPPQWLVLLPGYPFGFHLHIVLHFLIAAIGMYLFLRDLEVRAPAAMTGAVAFALGAPYLSLMIRLPFLFAMTWVPLILMFVRRAVLYGRRRDIALGAIFFGMQALLGEPVTVFQTAALAGSYVLYRKSIRKVVPLAVIILAGFLIAAVQLVPAFDHARDSVRSEGFRWVYASNWSTPPVRMLEVVYPRLFRAFASSDGSQAIRKMYQFRVEPFISEIYLGLLLAIPALAALLRGMRGRWYVLAILAVSLLLAFGQHAPLFRILHDSGLTKSIRYPEKFLLSGLFVLIVWGAMAIDRLQADAQLRKTAIALAILWTLGALLLWVTVKVPDATPMVAEAKALPWNAYWLMNLARVAAVVALLATAARGAKWWSIAIVAFTVVDLSFMHFADAERVSSEWFSEPKAAQGIRERASARLFHQGAWDEWESAPLAMSHFLSSGKRSDRVMRDAMFPFAPAAFGFRGVLEKDLDQTSLLVTSEYEKTAQDVKQRTGSWNPWFLESANVRWVARFLTMEESERRGTPVEIVDAGAHPRYFFATRLLPGADSLQVADELVANGAAATDAFVDVPFAPAAGRITHVDDSPSHVRIDAEASGRAFLVAANTLHKYWRATIDGKSVPIVKTNIAFQGVVVPPGKHAIEFRYRNPLVLPCLIVSLLTFLAALWTAVAKLPLSVKKTVAALLLLLALPLHAQTPLPAVIAAAKRQVGVTRYYDPAYRKLPYPNGDVPRDRGVCTDVVIRAFRAAGFDLQKLVHEDMTRNFGAYPKLWGLRGPDANIDHRRVPNLATFFTRHGRKLAVTRRGADYAPGDIVTWRLSSGVPHIGLVSDVRVPGTDRYLVVHNIGAGAQIEDVLFAYELTGHYKWL